MIISALFSVWITFIQPAMATTASMPAGLSAPMEPTPVIEKANPNAMLMVTNLMNTQLGTALMRLDLRWAKIGSLFSADHASPEAYYAVSPIEDRIAEVLLGIRTWPERPVANPSRASLATIDADQLTPAQWAKIQETIRRIDNLPVEKRDKIVIRLINAIRENTYKIDEVLTPSRLDLDHRVTLEQWKDLDIQLTGLAPLSPKAEELRKKAHRIATEFQRLKNAGIETHFRSLAAALFTDALSAEKSDSVLEETSGNPIPNQLFPYTNERPFRSSELDGPSLHEISVQKINALEETRQDEEDLLQPTSADFPEVLQKNLQLFGARCLAAFTGLIPVEFLWTSTDYPTWTKLLLSLLAIVICYAALQVFATIPAKLSMRQVIDQAYEKR